MYTADKGKGANALLLSFSSARRPHTRGAAGAGEYPAAQAGAAGRHSGITGRSYVSWRKYMYRPALCFKMKRCNRSRCINDL